MRDRAVFLGLAVSFMVGCAAIAGVSDYAVDPCFGGCPDGPTSQEGSTPDGPLGEGGGPDGPTDAPLDSTPLPSPGKSVVTVSGTGVAVGKSTIATLVAKDDAGTAVPRTGAKVTFTTSGGTSKVTFGATVDKGDGTYQATVTGVMEGTKLAVSATLDSAPLTTPTASLRVVNPLSAGLTFSIDAADADRMGNFGGKGCAGAGLVQWTDLTASSFPGALTGFADPCGADSGWNGDGTIQSPFRLTFDGVDDHVNFGAVNALAQQTIVLWIRQTGAGKLGTTGTKGFEPATVPPYPNIVPLIAKGTAETETDDKDIDYYLGITSNNHLGSDYESPTTVPASGNSPLMGATVLANDTWYMVGMTLDAVAGTRKLFLNGAQEASMATTNGPAGAASSLMTIGGARRTDAVVDTCPGGVTGCARFQGDIAAVLTYSRALTAAEIEKNCHSFSSRFGMSTCPN